MYKSVYMACAFICFLFFQQTAKLAAESPLAFVVTLGLAVAMPVFIALSTKLKQPQ